MLPLPLQHTLNALENNPEASGSLSLAHILLASHLSIFVNDRMNPLVMDITQWCAWMIGILVGICSLIGFTKRFINWLQSSKNGSGTTP